MHLARDVDGVGPRTDYDVAREFGSHEAPAAAETADLEANHVGENRARDILRRARRERSGQRDPSIQV